MRTWTLALLLCVGCSAPRHLQITVNVSIPCPPIAAGVTVSLEK